MRFYAQTNARDSVEMSLRSVINVFGVFQVTFNELLDVVICFVGLVILL